MRIFPLPGFRTAVQKDLPGECERYEAVIAEHGPIDLQLLGIGHYNGHIGFNEPSGTICSANTFGAAFSGNDPGNARFFAMPDRYLNRRLPLGIASDFCRRKSSCSPEGKGKFSGRR